MSLAGRVYQTFFKKSSTYFLTMVAGAFFFERFADQVCDNLFDSINRGKQWKDIKHLYVKSAESEDAE